MAWLRLDDGYDTHPKLLSLPEQQRWRWTRVLLYCARYRTRGRITQEALTEVGIDARLRGRLLELALLETADDVYTVNDWAVYNPVDPTSAERKRRFKERHGNDEGTDEEREGNGERNAGNAATRAAARARPVPNPTPSTKPSTTPAANVDLDAAPHAAAADHDQEQDPRLERLRHAGWRSPKQQTAAAEDPDRAIAWLKHALNDPTCHTPGALAWQNYASGADWPAEPQSTVAPGATGSRSTTKPLVHRCPECDLVLASYTEREDHIDAEHRTGVGAPPPAQLTPLRGQLDDDPEPQPA